MHTVLLMFTVIVMYTKYNWVNIQLQMNCFDSSV
uniref:Uncharacterized protein n=1 Tax=Anguilla anguilla TaxID=7936 RepID=A0A0E9PS93_ANGAN